MTSYQTNMKAIRLSIFLTILTLIMQACSPSNKGNEMTVRWHLPTRLRRLRKNR